jgi:1-aminocyclopropane-1-carboxylate deaminase/D-cysteine desulfhydrase-like pyridoxal-dependent ACC family enzyme
LDRYVQDLQNRNFEILYIHQGGILGNISMKERYSFKFDKKENLIYAK